MRHQKYEKYFVDDLTQMTFIKCSLQGLSSEVDTLHSNEMIDIEKRFLLLSQFASFSVSEGI